MRSGRWRVPSDSELNVGDAKERKICERQVRSDGGSVRVVRECVPSSPGTAAVLERERHSGVWAGVLSKGALPIQQSYSILTPAATNL